MPPKPPERISLPEQWLLECTTLENGTRCRERFRVDQATGEILERGALDGQPDLVLPEDTLTIPGFIDVHVHCRDDPSGAEHHKEDFGSASRAALHGGITLLGDMPNNPEPPIDRASYQAKLECRQERALVDIIPYGGIGPGTQPFGGELPYKCYFGPSIGDLNFVGSSPGETISDYRGLWITFHAEAEEILEAHENAPTHEERRPPEAEAEAIRQIAALAREHGFHPHIAHLSSAQGLEEVRKARASGLEMTTEVTPHHLFFDLENRSQFACGDWLQMNPPLRSPEHRAALRQGLLDGEIDILATDHAPHSLAENEKGISGVPLLDTFGGFVTHLAADGFSWPTLIDRCCRRPAELFAPFIQGRMGNLDVGSVASFTCIDEKPWTVRREDIQSRSGWSPFEGVTFPGRVIRTIVRGKAYAIPTA